MKEKYSIIRSADRYIEQRQYKKAIKVYQSLIDSGEKDPSVINSLGDLQYRDGDIKSALASYFKAASRYSESGDAIKSVGLCRKILRIDPSDDSTIDLFLDLNRKRDAVFDSIGFLKDLVRDYREKMDFNRAVILQEKLVEMDSNNAAAHFQLAELRFRNEQRDGASAALYNSLDLAAKGKSVPEGWDRISEFITAIEGPEDFQQFIQGLRDGYDPSQMDVPVPDLPQSAEITEDQVPEETTPKPVQDESLVSPEFFEVEGSLGTEEDLDEDAEAGAEDESSFDFQPQETVLSPPLVPPDTEEVPETEDAGVSARRLRDDSPADPDAQEEAVSDEHEFEINLDEEDLAESAEELLELLETDTMAEEDSGVSGITGSVEEAITEYDLPLEEEPGEEIRGEEEFPGEEEIAEEELSPSEFEGLDLEDLGDLEKLGEDDLAIAVSEEADIPEELLPEEMDIEILDSSEEINIEPGKDPGGNAIESALESIFVADDVEEGSFSAAVPEGVPEKEYIGTSRSDAGAGDESPAESEDDPEVQLELGIAYRDMALLEDAIGKYENALAMFEDMGNKDKCVRCCQLLAEGCNGLERFEETIGWVTRGLDYQAITENEIVNFEYESAVALEALGNFSESLKSYRRIQSINPDFRDVENRISALESTEQ